MVKRSLVFALVMLIVPMITPAIGFDAFPTDGLTAAPLPVKQLTPVEKLGRTIFFDRNLSLNSNQACASCHAPSSGWTGPNQTINAAGAVYEGSVPGAFGARKPPSSGYATLSPIFSMVSTGVFVGGNFWDGRATGQILGNPAADQAIASPFINPVEQALPDPTAVVNKICAAPYSRLFLQVWGPDACTLASQADIDLAWHRVGWSIAAFEDSPEVNSFASKYDRYLFTCIDSGNTRDACAKGLGTKAQMDPKKVLSLREWVGLQLFFASNNNDGALQPGEGGNCAACHVMNWTTAQRGVIVVDVPPAFTDFSFDNLGVPKNPMNPVYATNPTFVDPGLSGFLLNVPVWAQYAASNLGKHKVPTLRNVDKRPKPNFVKAYSHNGYFKSLLEIVHFYNTRDVLAVCSDPLAPADKPGVNCWPAPEVAQNVNTTELGKLGLSAADEANIVAFMKTLSDGNRPFFTMAREDEE